MRLDPAACALLLLGLGLFFSCATLPPEGGSPEAPAEEAVAAATAPAAPAPPEAAAGTAPGGAAPPPASAAAPPSPAGAAPRARPEQLSRPPRSGAALSPERPPETPVSPVPEKILGRGLTAAPKLAGFLRQANPQAGAFAEELAGFYVEEAAAEGVNHDVAFAQMCLETGFLRFGGLVQAEMNNFCGLGSIGPGQPGERFSEPRIGVRAHIQHLKAYATEEPLKQALVDPRYRYVRPGSSPLIKGLAGTWAADKGYAEKITGILERLYTFSRAAP